MLLLQSSNRHYGLGFVLSPHVAGHVVRFWVASDRVAIVQFTFGNNTISIVNVYALTSTLFASSHDHLDEFYNCLQDTVNEISSSSSLLYVVGDFNAKLGRCSNSICMGRYGRGRRNYSGLTLAGFCEANNFFVGNTAFQHRACHTTTWTGYRPGTNGKSVPIYNQIDFILCRIGQRKILSDARAYAGTATASDQPRIQY